MESIFKTLDENYIKFENKTIHVIIDNDNLIWFNANDTCDALGYKRPRDVIKQMVNKDEKINIENINMNIKLKKHPHTIYLSESGLYNLILQSRLKNG
jgi:prophage antirepressor-like protein